MTMPATARPLGDRLPSNSEKEAANQLRQILASIQSDENQTLKITERSGRVAEVVLTPALSDLLMQVLRPLGQGDAVTLVPVSRMLTTQQAADILNVSRPYFISLIEKREIECELVGRHRRVKAETLFDYKRRRDEARAQALHSLALADADLI